MRLGWWTPWVDSLKLSELAYATQELKMCMKQCFYTVFGCQNDTLKFCNDTLNSEGQDVVLPCLEVKRFEENMAVAARMKNKVVVQ